MELYKNIRKRRLEKGLSQDALASLTGYTDRSSIAKIEKGDVDLPESKIAVFAKALGTTSPKLMGWEEETTQYPSNLTPLTKSNFKKVPLIGSIACGVPILATENIEEYIDMDCELNADFALRCSGDSMINARIFNGDIVYIKKQSYVENGEIAAVLIGNSECEATLKRVYIDKEKVRLCAENPTCEDIIFFREEMDNVRIAGKAVAFLSSVR